MTFHFVKLVLKNKSYKDQVSTEGCEYVAQFKDAIKSKFSPELDSYDTVQLTLLQPDGTTEIDPGTLVVDLKEIPWKPMVVTVEESAPMGSSKKQLTYRGMSTEASCSKYLNSLALEIYFDYDFPITYKKPMMGDVLAARDGQFGKPKEDAKGVAWWDYKKENGIQYTNKPLPSILSGEQWDTLKSLDYDTANRIHDAQLPRTSRQKPFIVLPHTKFKPEYVNGLKSIAAIIGVVPTEDDLIVKDELFLSNKTGIVRWSTPTTDTSTKTIVNAATSVVVAATMVSDHDHGAKISANPEFTGVPTSSSVSGNVGPLFLISFAL